MTTKTESSFDPQATADTGFHSLLFEHLAGYSLVDYAYKTAQTYYTRVKGSNRVLKYGFETAEALTSAALPLVKTAAPLLAKADEFSLRQLERVEATLAKPYEKVRQLPYALLDKTLDFGEDTLDYWLPVEEEAKGKKEKPAEEKSLKNYQSRAYHLVDAFQVRAKDRISDVPIVSRSVNYVSTKVQDAKALGKRVYALPGTVRLSYQQRRDQVVSKVTALYTQLRLLFDSTTERAFDFLHNARLRLDALRSSTVQDLAVGLVNRLHELGHLLYERLFPAKLAERSKERLNQVVAQVSEYNPLHKKEQSTEKEEEPLTQQPAPTKADTPVPQEKATKRRFGRWGKSKKGKQINEDGVASN